MKIKRDITGIILAGGASSRMGENKALLNFRGIPVIENISGLLGRFCDEVFIVANKHDDYKFLNKKIYSDISPGFGPLSGIHSALVHSKSEINIIMSCDLPRVSNSLLNFLISFDSRKNIIAFSENGRVHPLFGVYKKNILPIVESMLLNAGQNRSYKKEVSMNSLIERCDAEIIDIKNLEFYTPDLMLNLNNADDYNYLNQLEIQNLEK